MKMHNTSTETTYPMNIPFFLLMLVLIGTLSSAATTTTTATTTRILLRQQRYDDPRNTFSLDGGGSSNCNSMFSCPECLNSNGCGWCVSNRGRSPSCQLDYQRDVTCGEDWVGSDPPDQKCPNRLFDGSASNFKHETNRQEGGFGTDETKGRFAVPSKYVLGKFKRPGLLGGVLGGLLGGKDDKLKYERPDIPEEVLDSMKHDNENQYVSKTGQTLPK
jgi:hypothetical protein